MLLSESWLRDWVNPDIDTDKLSEKLTLAGLEVEGTEAATTLACTATNRKKIVVGRIQSTSRHPDAETLKLCKVDIGGRKPLEIVCGASNAREGLTVAVARVGARIPGIVIKRSTICGVDSEAMLCSASELGLANQSEGILELDTDGPLGNSLIDYLALEDTVIEVDLTPNRGDCLSVQGVAREISALTGAKMKDIAVSAVRPKSRETLSIDMQAPGACPGFAGRIIRDIDMQAKTPDWMVEKLRRSGLRPINLVVDITNFVMLETGQPMHAYDFDKLSGGIIVRMAKKREKLQLLDGSTVSLDPSQLVIADHKKAVGLAGIMGSDNTAISDSTTNIYFEAAFFSPSHMLGKARQFGMHTDASYRFERGVNPIGQVAAIERATTLLLNSSPGIPGKTSYSSLKKHLPKRKAVVLNKSELPRILGIGIPARDVSAILKRLGMKLNSVAGGWKVTPPAWRFDIAGEHDLVEEVGRCYGYEKIPPKKPTAQSRTGGHPEGRIETGRIRHLLTDLGYYEAVNYSFVDPDAQRLLLESDPGIMLQNPIADNMAEMRQSLWPGLLSTLVRNLNRQEPGARLFETGNVFHKKGRKRQETEKLAALMCGASRPRQWATEQRDVDFFDLKGDLEILYSLVPHASLSFTADSHPALHPGQSAKITVNGKQAGWIGQLHPVKQKQLELNHKAFLFEVDLSSLSSAKLPEFVQISRYPAVQRDLAVVVDCETAAELVLSTVRSAAGDYLRKLELFDIYTGERVENNKKNFAFSLTFRSDSSNLTSTEIEPVIDKIIAALQANVGAELRN